MTASEDARARRRARLGLAGPETADRGPAPALGRRAPLPTPGGDTMTEPQFKMYPAGDVRPETTRASRQPSAHIAAALRLAPGAAVEIPAECARAGQTLPKFRSSVAARLQQLHPGRFVVFRLADESGLLVERRHEDQ